LKCNTTPHEIVSKVPQLHWHFKCQCSCGWETTHAFPTNTSPQTHIWVLRFLQQRLSLSWMLHHADYCQITVSLPHSLLNMIKTASSPKQ